MTKSSNNSPGCFLIALFSLTISLTVLIIKFCFEFVKFLYNITVSFGSWLNDQKITLPIKSGVQVTGLSIVIFLCCSWMGLSVIGAAVDDAARTSGMLPTYTPTATRTTRPTETPIFERPATNTPWPTSTPWPTLTVTPEAVATPSPIPSDTPVPLPTVAPVQIEATPTIDVGQIPTLVPQPPDSGGCCRHCNPEKSKPCGDSCISLEKECTLGQGCACSP
jgi:hypothetical protein